MPVANKNADGINRKVLATLNKEKVRANIWEYAVGLGGTTNDKYAFESPAIFPEKMAKDHIRTWSNPGDLVLDPMCVSGTTPKMATGQGRDYIGFDILAKYVGVAKKRVSGLFHHTASGKRSDRLETAYRP